MKLKRAGIITKIVIAAMIVYAVVSLTGLKPQIESAKKHQQELQESVERVMQENAELQYDIEHAADDETIEDIARSKLGLVKPGEVIFYDQSN